MSFKDLKIDQYTKGIFTKNWWNGFIDALESKLETLGGGFNPSYYSENTEELISKIQTGDNAFLALDNGACSITCSNESANSSANLQVSDAGYFTVDASNNAGTSNITLNSGNAVVSGNTVKLGKNGGKLSFYGKAVGVNKPSVIAGDVNSLITALENLGLINVTS